MINRHKIFIMSLGYVTGVSWYEIDLTFHNKITKIVITTEYIHIEHIKKYIIIIYYIAKFILILK